MVQPRKEKDAFDPDNPVTSVRHLIQHGTKECLGIMVLLWCPGCQALHSPKFRCPEHSGPLIGPIWRGDPHSNPFNMNPSLLVEQTKVSPRCHSFLRGGNWEFLGDCTHDLAGRTVPLEPLPNWIAKEVPAD